ncbi:hypothetical protein AYO45_06795 [Gammaproteobacteria bacterium SCGC AG-212-F23]|nr:hypothetical protein AYO45_06795 [Gammaproteobacteria bacterium SCGC AG-212-F23]
MKNFFLSCCGVVVISLSLTHSAIAATYSLPAPGNDIVGEVRYVSASSGETLLTVAQRNGIGVNQIMTSNPGMDLTTPLGSGTTVRIPAEFILPAISHRGIVINLPEMRMYYYPGDGTVRTYPVGIGRVGKTIPIQRTAVARKALNPTWTPPKDIRDWNAEQGITLPASMPAGPDNPLGPYAIYLRIPTFLIHSTIFPESIGKRASFGCIRMNEGDIKEFFPDMRAGLPVDIIDLPIKVGWYGNRVYLEAHPPLEERSHLSHASLNGVVRMIENTLPKNRMIMIDWQLVAHLVEDPDGVPHEIGTVSG